MKMTRIAAPEFDLAKTLDSGQVFHWERHNAGFVGTIDRMPVYVEPKGDELLVTGATAKVVRHYFALDHPLQKICAGFPRDLAMTTASEFCHGLRILRQPLWECLASFITSSMKQVAHIRQISRALRERFGEAHRIDGVTIFAFPYAARLAQTSERELRECALGYR